jgi:ubiquinone/menaquinone biosynthesis C-methylase UbiE
MESLEAARSNGSSAGCELLLARADIGRLPFRDGSADCVLANLPWGQAVKPEGAVRDDIKPAIGEIARVLAAGGNAVLLLPPDDAVADCRLRILRTISIRLAGRLTQIHVVSGNAGPERELACLGTRYGPALTRMWTRFGDPAVAG